MLMHLDTDLISPFLSTFIYCEIFCVRWEELGRKAHRIYFNNFTQSFVVWECIKRGIRLWGLWMNFMQVISNFSLSFRKKVSCEWNFWYFLNNRNYLFCLNFIFRFYYRFKIFSQNLIDIFLNLTFLIVLTFRKLKCQI